MEACATQKTRNNVKNNVATVFNALRFRAGLDDNPFRHVQNAVTSDSVSGREFARDEIARLLWLARHTEMYGAILTGAYSGLRWKDICHLRCSMIKDRMLWRISPSKTARHAMVADLPLHWRVWRHLTWRMDNGNGEWVFPSLHAEYKDKHRGRFVELLDKAKIDNEGGRIRFHCLRHTFRTWLSQCETRPDIAKKLGGWTTDISELYNHDYASMSAAINRLK